MFQGCRAEASVTAPLTLDIDTDLAEFHLDPVSISPYTLPGAGHSGHGHPTPASDALQADTSPKANSKLS